MDTGELYSMRPDGEDEIEKDDLEENAVFFMDKERDDDDWQSLECQIGYRRVLFNEAGWNGEYHGEEDDESSLNENGNYWQFLEV